MQPIAQTIETIRRTLTLPSVLPQIRIWRLLTFVVSTKANSPGAYAAGVDRIKTARFRAISPNSTLENEHAECLPKKDAAGVWHVSGAGGRVEPPRRMAGSGRGPAGATLALAGKAGNVTPHTH
jgi:hypothetical protein